MKAQQILALLITCCCAAINLVFADEPTPSRQSELKHLLLHDCGSCHGMTLNGGLGPALTPEALLNKSDAYLLQVINDGRPGTPMPPWSGLLSQADMQWLILTLKKGLEP